MALWKRTRTAAPARTGQTEQVPGYRDLHRIGHGGFSVVYRAHQEQIGRQVALKVLAVEFIDGRILRQFLREVQLTARLTGHPNVVTVLDSGLAASGRPYIAMDYYDRGSLKDRLQAEGPLPARDVLRIGVKIASALEAAHREGMLHRDVKPQNILVSRYGEPALGDFGTARLTAAIDTSASTAGIEALTPVHAAPEVLQGEAATERSDVYSLGSTLYQLLQGTPAFQRRADTGIAPLLLRVLTEPPPALTAQVPAELAEVVLTAMSRDQDRRYASAGAMAEALQAVQAELGMPVTEVPEHVAVAAYQAPDASAWAPDQGLDRPEPIQLSQASPETRTEAEADTETEPESDAESLTATATATATDVEQSAPLAATPWSGSETITGLRIPATPATVPKLPRTLPLPPEDSLDTAPTPSRPRGSRTPVLAGAVVVAVVGVAAAVLLGGRGTSSPPTPVASSASSAASTSAASAVLLPPPSGLTTHAVGSTVSLTWTLPQGAAYYPIVLDTSPSAGVSMRAIGNGATSTTVGGLDRAKDYCFKVGILDVIGTASQPSQFSWSAPVCTNG